MAIDTRDKRASAIEVGLPWRGLLPVPDGGLNQGDRQQVAFMYRGVLAQSAAPSTGVLPYNRPFILTTGRFSIN